LVFIFEFIAILLRYRRKLPLRLLVRATLLQVFQRLLAILIGRVADPNPSVSDPTLMSTTKLTGAENATMFGCCLAPYGPTDKKIKFKRFIKSTV
jgi:hypothetical protein